ncbi:MAG: response regulator [Desulfobacterales bacterium]|nr:response regulator [Desulfobacterales bacterium]
MNEKDKIFEYIFYYFGGNIYCFQRFYKMWNDPLKLHKSQQADQSVLRGVDSKKEQGSNFSIYLPASDEPIHQTMEISKRIIAGNETILLIDDEEMVIDVGVALLNRIGYTVLKAMNGYEAIEAYKEKKDEIDLVILDMIMPDIGGGETYDTLKKIDSEVKVLLSSGYSLSGQAGEILDRGCNGFIQKPFNMRTLSQKIREVLSDDNR